jgi:hypothetical protein
MVDLDHDDDFCDLDNLDNFIPLGFDSDNRVDANPSAENWTESTEAKLDNELPSASVPGP